MDQKNTIVKCKAHPNCLFNHNGVCGNYVINIGVDGKCECYVETAHSEEASIYNKTKEMLKGSDIILLNRECGECHYFADTGLLQCPCDKHEQYVYRKAPACGDFKTKRGQRAKCNVFDDTCDDKAAIQDELLRQQMCWYCDNGSHGSCKLTAKPSLDSSGKCPRYTSTGGNR